MKPILFSTPMVQAILGDRKTQTRRIVKGPYFVDEESVGHFRTTWRTAPRGGKVDRIIGGMPYPEFPHNTGDILWVRETFCPNWCDHVIYKADGGSAKAAGYSAEPKWKPSIFMPREAARIFLRITDVRVERLQDISDRDCRKEGIQIDYTWWSDEYYRIHVAPEFINAYRNLWDKLNAKRGFGWDINPWVWVYEFERISKEEL